MYAITATIFYNVNGWNASRHLPAFCLDENIQGINSADHAKRIARSIIDPCGLYHAVEISAEFLGKFPPAETFPQVVSHMRAGRRVSAVKEYRTAVNCTLKEALDAVKASWHRFSDQPYYTS